MLPILISVSLAPVSYFLWANALLHAKASAAATSRAVRNLSENIVSPRQKGMVLRSSDLIPGFSRRGGDAPLTADPPGIAQFSSLEGRARGRCRQRFSA